jgi:hypothetical protein
LRCRTLGSRRKVSRGKEAQCQYRIGEQTSLGWTVPIRRVEMLSVAALSFLSSFFCPGVTGGSKAKDQELGKTKIFCVWNG